MTVQVRKEGWGRVGVAGQRFQSEREVARRKVETGEHGEVGRGSKGLLFSHSSVQPSRAQD